MADENSVPRLTPERVAEIQEKLTRVAEIDDQRVWLERQMREYTERYSAQDFASEESHRELGVERGRLIEYWGVLEDYLVPLFAEFNALRADVAAANERAAQAERRVPVLAECFATLREWASNQPFTTEDAIAFADRYLELEDTVGSVEQYVINESPMVVVYPPPADSASTEGGAE